MNKNVRLKDLNGSLAQDILLHNAKKCADSAQAVHNPVRNVWMKSEYTMDKFLCQ